MAAKRVQKKVLKKPLTVKSKIQTIESKVKLTDIVKPQPKKPADHPIDPDNGNVRYWLIKSEPLSRIDPKTNKDVAFPFSELLEVEHEEWNGVRNYEAKNNMLNMRSNDFLLFYHSNTPNPGIVGLAIVANEAHPDSLQFDKSSNYYDPKSTPENPRWWCVDVKFGRRFKAKIPLQELRDNPKLQEMSLVKRGRLSVTPVRKEEYYEILKMESTKKVSNDIDCDIDEKHIDFIK